MESSFFNFLDELLFSSFLEEAGLSSSSDLLDEVGLSRIFVDEDDLLVLSSFLDDLRLLVSADVLFSSDTSFASNLFDDDLLVDLSSFLEDLGFASSFLDDDCFSDRCFVLLLDSFFSFREDDF